MSRILRRPMFRGGPVDSRGSGITSGLMDGGRVGYKKGNLVAPLYSASPEYKSGAEIRRDAPGIFGLKFDSPFLSMKTPEVRIGKPRFDLGQSPSDFADALSEGSAYREYLTPDKEEFETEITEDGDVKFKLDENGDRIPIKSDKGSLAEIIEKQRIENITDSDTQGSLEAMGITVKDDGSTEFTGDPRYSDQKIKTTETPKVSGGDGTGGGEKEESVEYTIEDYIKMLGGDKARRRDLGDMFARASASFLGTGGVREGLAEFMKSEAAAGPSRREKIEQAAATLDIKDKLSQKQSDRDLTKLLGLEKAKVGIRAAGANPKNIDWAGKKAYYADVLNTGSLKSNEVIRASIMATASEDGKDVFTTSNTEVITSPDKFNVGLYVIDGGEKGKEVIEIREDENGIKTAIPRDEFVI